MQAMFASVIECSAYSNSNMLAQVLSEKGDLYRLPCKIVVSYLKYSWENVKIQYQCE